MTKSEDYRPLCVVFTMTNPFSSKTKLLSTEIAISPLVLPECWLTQHIASNRHASSNASTAHRVNDLYSRWDLKNLWPILCFSSKWSDGCRKVYTYDTVYLDGRFPVLNLAAENNPESMTGACGCWHRWHIRLHTQNTLRMFPRNPWCEISLFN